MSEKPADEIVVEDTANDDKGSLDQVEDVAKKDVNLETTGSAVATKVEDDKETTHDEKKGLTQADDDDENPPSLPSRKSVSTGTKTPDKNPILEQLKEAFPNLEDKYIKAVIIASQGAVDPAFNALLYLSDPESGKDIELPSEPVTEQVPQLPARRKQTQLEQDEMLARQLDEQFNKNSRRSSRGQRQRPTMAEREAHRQRLRDRQRRDQESLSPEEQRELYGDDEDPWAQFMEKDLPELREKANRSIQDTATKLNGWFSGIRKNIVGEYPEGTATSQQQGGYYDDPYSQRDEREYNREELPKKPERRRFNSFGAQIGDDSLESHGISLRNDDVNDELDEEDDIPPQIGSKSEKAGSSGFDTEQNRTNEKVVAQTTYIDTPDASSKKKWQPVPPEPLSATPTKAVATPDQRKSGKNADDDDFLLNSEDEM